MSESFIKKILENQIEAFKNILGVVLIEFEIKQ